jgi:bacteriorhodopsin
VPPEPLRFVARAPRSRFGRVVKWLFWIVALAPPLLMMAACGGLARFVLSEDEEVAAGALMFGVDLIGMLWVVWLLGTPLLAVFMLLTRGKQIVIEQAPPSA